MYNNIFLKSLQSTSVRFFWHLSTNRCYRRKMSSISEFLLMFKDSLCREKLTNLDAKGTKRNLKMWITNFQKNFFQKKMLHMNGRLSKIHSVQTVFWLNLYVQLQKKVIYEFQLLEEQPCLKLSVFYKLNYNFLCLLLYYKTAEQRKTRL